jgi:hypothetical protein
MNPKKIVDKTIRPMSTTGLVSPLDVTGGRPFNQLGYLPLGAYKGTVAFWDLDKAVNQPLVWAEQQHILGILDGREEDYDLQSLTIPAASAAGTALSGALTVPAGQVWYINAVHMHLDDDATAGVTGNWRCSLWTDRSATPSPAGQAFWPNGVTNAAGSGAPVDNYDEFGPWTTLLAVTNKTSLLRLPAGAVITFTVVSITAVATADMPCYLALNGFIGKALVA